MSYHSVKAINVIRNSPEYAILKNVINGKAIRILIGLGSTYEEANLSVYLTRLIINSEHLNNYKVYVNGQLLPQGQIPKEVQDCLNIPEVISLTLQHRLGVSI